MKFDNERRVRLIKQLIDKGNFVTNGQVVAESATGNNMGIFIVKTSLKDGEPEDLLGKSYFATPTGLPLFEASEFHEYCQEKAKEAFTNNLDKVLKAKAAILPKS